VKALGAPSLELRVRERILAGEPDDAARLLDADRDRDPESFELELELAGAYLDRGMLDAARERLDALSRRRLDRPARVRLHAMRARLERLSGNEHQYRWEIEQRDRNLQP
jgi:thioredoxin-like negative regulator of GroEL